MASPIPGPAPMMAMVGMTSPSMKPAMWTGWGTAGSAGPNAAGSWCGARGAAQEVPAGAPRTPARRRAGPVSVADPQFLPHVSRVVGLREHELCEVGPGDARAD